MSLKQKNKRNFYAHTKRGDTIVEVMFAMAVFCFVAVLAISSMNLGLGKAEGNLELTTVRNEINAQAEAIRYVAQAANQKKYDSSAGATTPIVTTEFQELWNMITTGSINGTTSSPDAGAISANTWNTAGFSDISNCNDYYSPSNRLQGVNAFVLNARNLNAGASAYISANGSSSGLFRVAPLSSRIIYNTAINANPNDQDGSDKDLDSDKDDFDTISRVEGMWDVAVKSDDGQYYDFYIGACWYPPNSKSPTKLDTVIRIYNKQ